MTVKLYHLEQRLVNAPAWLTSDYGLQPGLFVAVENLDKVRGMSASTEKSMDGLDPLRPDHTFDKSHHGLRNPEPWNKHRYAGWIWHEELRGNAPYRSIKSDKFAIAQRGVPRQDDRLPGNRLGNIDVAGLRDVGPAYQLSVQATYAKKIFKVLLGRSDRHKEEYRGGC